MTIVGRNRPSSSHDALDRRFDRKRCPVVKKVFPWHTRDRVGAAVWGYGVGPLEWVGLRCLSVGSDSKQFGEEPAGCVQGSSNINSRR